MLYAIDSRPKYAPTSTEAFMLVSSSHRLNYERDSEPLLKGKAQYN
jgi:hypothetical protein